MGIFNSIKKSRRASGDIDEKIEYLNKELEKTGLREAMSTSNIYVGGQSVDNPIYTSFNNATFNGLSLGHSGADGVGSGGAYTGKMIPSEVGLQVGSHDSILNTPKAALSPPHPVSGKRRYATTRLGGMIGQQFFPTQPGVIQGNRTLPTGSVAWLWNPNINNSDGTTGNWYPLEFEPHNGLWGFWDTNFMGFGFLNLNLDQLEFTSGDNTGSTVVSLFSSIGIGNKNNVGTEKTIVLQKNNLDDPSFLPINIDGLSTQGFNYLKDKAKTTASSGVNYDLSNWINKTYGGAASNWYENNPSLPHESNPHIPAVEAPYVPLASADSSPEFASAPSDAFEPETVEVEITPEDIPDEFKTDSEDKPSAQGVTLTKWMSRTDFMKQYPDSSMTEFLSALPYGATNFMKPDPNFPGARIVDTAAYERYFMTGDTSGVSGKPKHSKATPEPEQKKWGGKTKDEILAELDADIEKLTAAEKAAHQEMRSIALELGADFVSLIGGLFTGGTTAAPVLGKIGIKLLKKYGKTVAGKMIRKLVKRFRNKKNSQQLDDMIDAIEKGGNESGSVDLPDDGIGPRPVPPKPKKKIPDDMEYNWNPTGGSDGRGQWEVRDIPSTPKSTTPKPNIPPKPKKKLPDGFEWKWNPGDASTGGKGKWTAFGNFKEEAKLGHFEPEQLNVDIEQLRKGIMPEFPKDPPPKLINGYSEKSKLAPKELERSSFIKITKKDLAKNHRLKDSEIKDFMDQINAVNDFIKKHPEELVYAQTRYPKNDPRLAQLNWQMDQMLGAGKEYMDKHYPENQKLFTKIQKSISKNIELTDPKSFKGVKVPKFEGVDLTDFKRRKEVVSRHYKKTVKTKKLFSRKKT